MLWDLSREDDLLVASSGIDDDSHQEPVSKVHWITDSKGKKIYVSTSYELATITGCHYLFKAPDVHFEFKYSKTCLKRPLK